MNEPIVETVTEGLATNAPEVTEEVVKVAAKNGNPKKWFFVAGAALLAVAVTATTFIVKKFHKGKKTTEAEPSEEKADEQN